MPARKASRRADRRETHGAKSAGPAQSVSRGVFPTVTIVTDTDSRFPTTHQEQQMTRSILTLAGLVLLAACGDSTGPNPTNISGTWQFSSNMTATQHSISCTAMGSVTMSQSGSSFNGSGQQQGTCTGPGGSLDNSGPISISGGQISGSQVTFQAPFCQYTGRIESDNRMSGSQTCSIQEAGVTYNFSGDWQASR